VREGAARCHARQARQSETAQGKRAAAPAAIPASGGTSRANRAREGRRGLRRARNIERNGGMVSWATSLSRELGVATRPAVFARSIFGRAHRGTSCAPGP
jgi:hypothetical protein